MAGGLKWVKSGVPLDPVDPMYFLLLLLLFFFFSFFLLLLGGLGAVQKATLFFFSEIDQTTSFGLSLKKIRAAFCTAQSP